MKAIISVFFLILAFPTLARADKPAKLGLCAACHGENGKGQHDLGAPDLTDANWVYGGDLQSVVNSIHGGRQGHMPSWEGRLSPTDIKLLALYVGTLGEAKR